MDKREVLWFAHEIESRYSMVNLTLEAFEFKLNVTVFPTEAVMMKTLLEDFRQAPMCTDYIGMSFTFKSFNFTRILTFF